MVHIIMGHGASGCFGTTLAPNGSIKYFVTLSKFRVIPSKFPSTYPACNHKSNLGVVAPSADYLRGLHKKRNILDLQDLFAPHVNGRKLMITVLISLG